MACEAIFKALGSEVKLVEFSVASSGLGFGQMSNLTVNAGGKVRAVAMPSGSEFSIRGRLLPGQSDAHVCLIGFLCACTVMQRCAV
jgi:hypothetical protein